MFCHLENASLYFRQSCVPSFPVGWNLTALSAQTGHIVPCREEIYSSLFFWMYYKNHFYQEVPKQMQTITTSQ